MDCLRVHRTIVVPISASQWIQSTSKKSPSNKITIESRCSQLVVTRLLYALASLQIFLRYEQHNPMFQREQKSITLHLCTGHPDVFAALEGLFTVPFGPL